MKAVCVAIIELLDLLYGALDLQQHLASSLLKLGATETTGDRNIGCAHVYKVERTYNLLVLVGAFISFSATNNSVVRSVTLGKG